MDLDRICMIARRSGALFRELSEHGAGIDTPAIGANKVRGRRRIPRQRVMS